MCCQTDGITQISIGGGVSANSGLRNSIVNEGELRGTGQHLFLSLSLQRINAAMIAITGFYKFRKGETCSIDVCSHFQSITDEIGLF